MRRMGMALGWAAVVLCASAAAAAQPDAAVSPDRTQADALFRQGVAADKTGDLERAQRLFEASYALLPRGTTLGNWGQMEVKLGRPVSGLQRLKLAVAMLDASDARRALFQQDIEQAYAKTGHVAIRTQTGAAVAVDGELIAGAAPFAEPIDVMPGKHVLEARLEGQGGRARQEVEAPAGSVVQVELTLPKQSETAAAPPPAPPPPRERIVLAPAPESPAPSSWWTTPRVAGVALGAGAALGFGVGIVFHVAAVNAANDANQIRNLQIAQNQCGVSPASPACGDLRSKIESVHDNETEEKVSWVIAGVAAAGAVVAFLWGAPGSVHPHTAMVVRPMIAPGALGIDGSF